MRILIAPDSFKGSLSAEQVAEALAVGARWACPDAEIDVVPLADGGEGTLSALTHFGRWRISRRAVATTDALGRDIVAEYGWRPGPQPTAFVELAAASGMGLVRDVNPPQPGRADTYGTGTLVADALDAGAEEIVLCLGGSATIDGGTGLLRALGVQFLDERGQPLAPGGESLVDLAHVDASRVHRRARAIRWRIACDVNNPACGPSGAAAVFGPQKGADTAMVDRLEAGLARLVEVLAADVVAVDVDRPGMGAAGATPIAVTALVDAELISGAELVFDVSRIGNRLARADLALTGEGSFDEQSLRGKLVGALAMRAQSARVPLVVIAGQVGVRREQARAVGVTAAFSLADGPRTLTELMSEPGGFIADRAAHVVALFAAARGDDTMRP